MNLKNRKTLDKSFNTIAYSVIVLMCIAISAFLIPIIVQGVGAFIFNATIEHEKFLNENLAYKFSDLNDSKKKSDAVRSVLYDKMNAIENPSKVKEYEDLLEKILKSNLSNLENNYSEILQIFDEENFQERLLKLKNFCGNFSLNYEKEFLLFIADIKNNGAQFALNTAINVHDEKIASIIKEEIENLLELKKLSFNQKSSLRRNLSEAIKNKILEQHEILENETKAYLTLKIGIRELLGPATLVEKENFKLMRQKYGQTRFNLAKNTLKNSILKLVISAKDADSREISLVVDSKEYFSDDTNILEIINFTEENLEKMLLPHWTVYWGFFFDEPFDANIFGGIWPMILGTFYLTFGAMLIASPLGIIAAIYFSEYAKRGILISFLRMCVGTLAGVPSIVFGLFGLAFIINTCKISEGKSVLAGAITLALLILPTIIRACEESLKRVPNTYREASLGLGAGKWKCITSVVLPAAIPGMLTGMIISMGRAAGETAPIIFTAATSTGGALAIWKIFNQPTPALPWNIYNICAEHELADKVLHVQYGMVFALIAIVISLNLVAIIIRAKLQKKFKV